MKISRKQLRSLIIEQFSHLNEEVTTLAALASAGTISANVLASAQALIRVGLTTAPEMVAAFSSGFSAPAAHAAAHTLGGATQLPAAGSVSGAAGNLTALLSGGGAGDAGVGVVLKGAAAAEILLLVAGIAGIAGIAATGSMAAFETLKRNKKSTASFALDVIKRSMSRSFKRNKKNMDELSQKMGSKAIRSSSIKSLNVALETGLLKLDVNDLYDVYENMKKSASVEYVDLDAIEKMLEEIKALVR